MAARNAGTGLPSGHVEKSSQAARPGVTGCAKSLAVGSVHQQPGCVACGMWWRQSPHLGFAAVTGRKAGPVVSFLVLLVMVAIGPLPVQSLGAPACLRAHPVQTR
jgi:CelD/BcsL family acetyltransferase involved in cellulose biosynthesis